MAAELLVDELGPDLLRVVGEIDTHTAPTLAERLADIPAHTALGIDLTATSFISSAGLAVLLVSIAAELTHVQQPAGDREDRSPAWP